MEFDKRRAMLLCGLLVAAPSAMQTALAQAPQVQEIEEVVVTGTRLRDPNVISSSQITTVQIEDISDRGITRVEDYLNDLPQISPGQAITASNGSSGTATVNVRNLGCARTLVLINGQRLAPGTTNGGNCADLNSIPTLLLERVEVLTGGASSVYGSDAVGGVVNFILDEDFEGFKANYMHSFYQHKNDNGEFRDLVRSYNYDLADENVTTGETNKLAAAFGGSIFDGRGHITGFLEKTDTSPILQGDYDISACALTRGKSGCGGSSTIPPGRWADFGNYGRAGYVNKDPSVTRLDLKVQGDEFVPRDGQTFNYNPTNFFQRPDERFNAGFFGNFEISPNIEAYANVRSMQSESNAQIAYSGTFGNITAIPCYHALLSRQQYDTVCGDWEGMGGDHAPDFPSAAAALAYISSLDLAVGDGDIIGYNAPLYSLKRNVEGGPRQSVTTFDNTVSIYGLRGEIANGWTYDVSYQLSDVEYTQEYRNDLSVIAMNRAIDVISVNGTPTCVAALNGTDTSCIPYNLFQGGMPGDGGIQGVIDGGAALQQYIANSTFVRGTGEQSIVQAVASGEFPLTLPGAPSPISAAFGVETKDLSTDYRPDRPSRTGDRSGSGGATLPLAGGYEVNEYFVELGIPVLDNLSFDAGYRYADYSTGHSTNTYKLGAFWQVSDDVALRASFPVRDPPRQPVRVVPRPGLQLGRSAGRSLRPFHERQPVGVRKHRPGRQPVRDRSEIAGGSVQHPARRQRNGRARGIRVVHRRPGGHARVHRRPDADPGLLRHQRGAGHRHGPGRHRPAEMPGYRPFGVLQPDQPPSGQRFAMADRRLHFCPDNQPQRGERRGRRHHLRLRPKHADRPGGTAGRFHVLDYIGPYRTARRGGSGVRGLLGHLLRQESAAPVERQLQGDLHDALRHPHFAGVATSWQDRGPGFQRDQLRFRNLLGSYGGVERHRQLHRHRRHQQPVRHRPASQFRRGHRAWQRQHVSRRSSTRWAAMCSSTWG